jgi:Arc/MetJ family transcription regulator
MMFVRIAVNLDDKLFEKAKSLTGIREKRTLINAGLDALVAREAARRLVALGGSEPNVRRIRRRRPRK